MFPHFSEESLVESNKMTRAKRGSVATEAIARENCQLSVTRFMRGHLTISVVNLLTLPNKLGPVCARSLQVLRRGVHWIKN